jgi:hypothetical protein
MGSVKAALIHFLPGISTPFTNTTIGHRSVAAGMRVTSRPRTDPYVQLSRIRLPPRVSTATICRMRSRSRVRKRLDEQLKATLSAPTSTITRTGLVCPKNNMPATVDTGLQGLHCPRRHTEVSVCGCCGRAVRLPEPKRPLQEISLCGPAVNES